MSPLETRNLRTTAFMVRADQIEKVDDVKARIQKKKPTESVSRSEVVRDALDLALPQMSAVLDQIESDESEEVASLTEASIRGP